MTRTSVPLLVLLAVVSGCGQDYPRSPVEVDCSVLDEYEFLNISDFTAGSYWYQFGDPTPGGIPGATPMGDVPVAELPAPGRCNDTRYVEFRVSGHHFWGAGFGEWAHNAPTARANGTDYEGISFWARSPRNVEKTFLFGVDDGRTMIDSPDEPPLPDECVCGPVVMGPMCEPNAEQCAHREAILRCRPSVLDQGGNQDLDGDGCIGPGDIAAGTRCRLPPSSDVGSANCYNGGVEAPPSGGARVPLANECGNQFHTWITTTETWQLFRIPFEELVQWPCPNRLAGGIDVTDIAKFEIKAKQGMTYEIWLDNIAFYRRR